MAPPFGEEVLAAVGRGRSRNRHADRCRIHRTGRGLPDRYGQPPRARVSASHTAVAGSPLPLGAKPFVDDGNIYASLGGIPALTHGPAATGAHTLNEAVPVAGADAGRKSLRAHCYCLLRRTIGAALTTGAAKSFATGRQSPSISLRRGIEPAAPGLVTQSAAALDAKASASGTDPLPAVRPKSSL